MAITVEQLYQQSASLPNPGGDYKSFENNLKDKSVNPLAAINNLSIDPDGKNKIIGIYNEILNQQSQGSTEFWSAGRTSSPEAAAADFALRLVENGITSLNQLGQVQTTLDLGEDGGRQDNTTLINKTTGEPLPFPEKFGRGTRGLGIDYNFAFAADGTAIPFTSNRQSSWVQFREDALKPAAAFALTAIGAPIIGASVAPGLSAATQGALGGAIAGGGAAALTGNNVLQGALLGGVGGYLQGANAAPNTAGYYDEITGQFIRDPNGLLPGPLSELTGTNIGSMDGYSYDPTTQTWTMPDGTQVTSLTGVTNGAVSGADLLAEAGATAGAATGATSGATTGAAADAGAAAGSGLTNSQIGNLVKAGLGLLGGAATVGAIGSSGGGNNTAFQAPTQSVPTNDPNYYNQLQQYYNSYLPQTPRDVVTPLQQWYNSSYGA